MRRAWLPSNCSATARASPRTSLLPRAAFRTDRFSGVIEILVRMSEATSLAVLKGHAPHHSCACRVSRDSLRTDARFARWLQAQRLPRARTANLPRLLGCPNMSEQSMRSRGVWAGTSRYERFNSGCPKTDRPAVVGQGGEAAGLIVVLRPTNWVGKYIVRCCPNRTVGRSRRVLD